MDGTWHAIVSDLGKWTVSGIAGFIGGLIASVFRWRWPSWKELQEERREKRANETDARIMELLDGIGSSVIVAVEISQELRLEEQTVRDSLDRLEMRGRVRMGGPSFDSPACWFSLHR